MGWKENKQAYIKSYIMEKYHRITVVFRMDNANEVDAAIWEEIKDKPNKAKALKDLAYKGLGK